jgi:WD40 repeat protein
VWPLHVLNNIWFLLFWAGLSIRVNLLEFSEDSKFLLGSGEDSLLYIWDILSGEVVYGQRFDKPVSVVKWGGSYMDNRRTAYELAVGSSSTMCKGYFCFDPSRVQWNLELTPFALPSGGLTRFFSSIEFSDDKRYLYVGSTGADLLIFRHDIGVYRAMIPVGSNGVRSLLRLPNGDLLCGGGDGTITTLRGEDLSWEALDSVSESMCYEIFLQSIVYFTCHCICFVNQVKLGSKITSMTLASNETEFVVGVSSGEVVRCLASGLSTQVVTSCHSSEISSIVFGNAGTFVTGTRDGYVKVWDITDYACISTRKESNGAVLCLSLIKDDTAIVCGWEDGKINCYDIELGRQLWYINQAHKLGTTSIAICDSVEERLQYMASGGGDGAVRIWRLGNRELLNQYSEHAKGISKVLVDNQHTNLVHSASLDCTVLSYNLKISKRQICHIIKGGHITDMTQRWDSENELVTCDTNGRLLHWDIDVREPVLAIKDAGHLPNLRTCAISPTGNYLAFAGDDSMLKILHVPSSQIVSLGRGHSGVITCLAWTPDEKQIVTGGFDSCMCVWNFYLGGMS